MHITAQRVYVDGAFVRDLEITLDEAGRIAHLAASANAIADPQHRLASRAIVPAAASALLLSPLEDALGGCGDGGSVAQRVSAVLAAAARKTPHQVRDALASALQRAAAQGQGTVGLLVPSHLGEAPDDAARPLLREALAAAQQIGLRTALLFPFAPPASLRGDWIERANKQLGSAVNAILSRQDARLSWGVALIAPAAWRDDELVALRLRLSHLPLLVADDGAIAARLHAVRGLDACVTIVSTDRPGPTLQAALHDTGALWLGVDAADPAPAQARTASATTDPLLGRTWAQQAALSVRRGEVAVGRWADWRIVAWGDEAAVVRALTRESPLSPGSALWVAGRPVAAAAFAQQAR